MAEIIRMPRLSDTMTEGVIAAWHKQVGDAVKKGDLLAEVETDKATMELESYQDGILLYQGVQNGQSIPVDGLLAILGAAGEDFAHLLDGAAAPVAATPAPVETAAPAPAAPAVTNNGSGKSIGDYEEAILMPRLSDTMTEGVIAAWHKKIGDAVTKGELLAEVETDKATMELESYKSGTLLYIGAQSGDKIPVNALLCIIGEQGKVDVDAIVAAAQGGTAAPAENTSAPAAPAPVAAPTANVAPAAAPAVVNEGRILASPLAKKLAEEKGIDLKYVAGSGDNGRIVKRDVDQFNGAAAPAAQAQAVAQTPAAKTTSPAPVAVVAGQENFTEVTVTQMRKTIARRLSESLFTAPHFYLTMSINMDNAVASRAQLNEVSPVKISFNDMVVKAVALSLKQHPAVNSSWLGDKIRINHHVNIGVAVAVEDGLLVPVVRYADGKSLSQIGAEVKDFAKRAKEKKLQPADWEGSTFTISNLGMFGIDQFTAIINPPDACILAVGGISQEPIVKNGQIVPGNIMKVTLSCDHRVVDGASGAAFLQTLKAYLENPITMLV